MATAPSIDFESRRQELERELKQVERDLAREAHARITGEGDPGAVESLRSRADALRQEIAELVGAKSYDAAVRSQAAERERLEQRRRDSRVFGELLAGLVGKATRVERGAPLFDLGAAIADMNADLDQAFALWISQVDAANDIRKTDRIEGIRRALGFKAIGTWLEGAAYRAGLLPMRGAPGTWASMADQTLTEIVAARMEVALKQAVREFPELGEA